MLSLASRVGSVVLSMDCGTWQPSNRIPMLAGHAYSSFVHTPHNTERCTYRTT
jgi:hypothetical protein